jgi:hypothetical protein
MQLVVETARVANRVTLFVATPEWSYRCATILARNNQGYIPRRRLCLRRWLRSPLRRTLPGITLGVAGAVFGI